MVTTFWDGRDVLVTGHTGFKGAWLCLWLERLGANVTGLALAPEDPMGAFTSLGPWRTKSRITDLRNAEEVSNLITETRPQVVFHLGAQALVRRAYADPRATYETNVLGTFHVLQAAEEANASAVVVVTSDKVYENDGSGRRFRESDRLGGSDPYSTSKACAELVTATWGRSVPTVAVATARAGNVIGGGDRGHDRLLPDAWKALLSETPLEIRNPRAVRPWQFVLDPLYGYMQQARRLVEDPEGAPRALNFGPNEEGERSVEEVVAQLFSLWGGGTFQPAPGLHPLEAAVLRLDASLAEDTLGWAPVVSLEEGLHWTVDWWRAAADNRDLRTLAIRQVAAYEARIGW